jgi:transposase-like protein
MSDAALSPEQRIVITALSEGVNMTDAAAQAGVHRNTIANWRRNSILFREALADAQYDRALLFRDKAEELLDLAFETLNSILTDPKASPSVRLKAAMFIIEKATTPPSPRKYAPLEIEEVRAPEKPPAENVHKMHNDPQTAQTPFRRETPKVGRNEPCPCGSGRKYKYCCLNQPQSAAA